MAANDTPANSSLQTVRHNFKFDILQKQRLQHLLHSNPSDGWKCMWEEGVIPCDLGKPTPILQHLLETNAIPKGRALIPGCGSGYDVITLAKPDRYVVGLDIAEAAINKAIKLASSSPNANYISFLQADFFSWEPTELFDVIFDHRFFCVIVPKLRPAWAACMARLLKPHGELITIMFMIDGYEDIGHEPPPYKTSVKDYEEVLHPLGFYAESIVDNELPLSRRKGREKIGRWRRVTTTSEL